MILLVLWKHIMPLVASLNHMIWSYKSWGPVGSVDTKTPKIGEENSHFTVVHGTLKLFELVHGIHEPMCTVTGATLYGTWVNLHNMWT